MLATRPAERAGDEASWDRAEDALRKALAELGWAVHGAGGRRRVLRSQARVRARDRLGRAFSCGTIQFDLVMPRRFDIRYVDERGERDVPVMLHRALYGSLERFMGMLLEHHGSSSRPGSARSRW